MATPQGSSSEPLTTRTLAMIGYGLIVASLFTFWLTGLAAWLLAFFNRKSPDPVARAHFRFQLLVADLAGLAVGIAATLAVCALIVLGGPLFDGDWPTLRDFGGAAGLVGLGLVLWAASFAGTLAGAAFGAWRLVRGREVRLRLPTRRHLTAAP